MSPTRPHRTGLAASAGLQSGPQAPLFRFMADLAPFFAGVLRTELHIVGATYDALQEASLLQGLSTVRLAQANEGGLITLTALLVGLGSGDPGLDWIIYLQDPRDPISLYPEAQALKRQCVVHGKPFLASVAGTYEWCLLEWWRSSPASVPHPLLERSVRPETVAQETIALIAHDTMKPVMMEFAARHRDVLSRFGRRLATGTTGSLLNGQVPARLTGADYAPLERGGPDWVQALLSGPKGGDAQIAEEVVAGRCRRAVFFEDPHVAREHEADIQLLERATRFAAEGCLCMTDPATATRWAENMALLLADRQVVLNPPARS